MPDGSLFDPRLLTYGERRNSLNLSIPQGLQFKIRLLSVIHREKSHWKFLLSLAQFGENDLLNSVSVEVTLEGPDFRGVEINDAQEFRLYANRNAIGFLLPELNIVAKFLNKKTDPAFPYELELNCNTIYANSGVTARHRIPAFFNPAEVALAGAVGAVTPGGIVETKCDKKSSNPLVKCCYERTCTKLENGSCKWSAWIEVEDSVGCPNSCARSSAPAI
jgi:hypothetical protein